MCTLVARVASVASSTPTRTAIVDGERSVDFAQFWRLAHGFANELLDHGLAPGDRVAIVLPNRIESAAACYGTWLAGMVAVPLNAQARTRDLAPWLAHCGARLVVYEAGNSDIRAAIDQARPEPQAIALEPAACAWLAADAVVRERHADITAPALILYTSGTTGAPKGVTLSHANLFANVTAVVDYLGLVAGDSVLSVLPFYYAYGASVLHTHLTSGACVVLEPNMVFPHIVAGSMARHRVSGFSGVPSTYALLLDRVDLAAHDLSSLRYLTQAGGAMAPALVRRLRAALPDARLFLMYGQTEATSRLTWLPPDRLDDKVGSVGIPLRGVEVRILLEDGASAAHGEDGEVVVRGANVMLGYWNAPDATARVLRDGWLHTGDLGHLDGDGFLHLAGRRSDMIKTGAHRIHPGDVEEAIAELEGISEVAVVGVDDPVLGQVVKAYVVASAPLARGADAVKAHCRARLAAYKVPRHVEFVDALPRTMSGKVRRLQLMQPWTTQ